MPHTLLHGIFFFVNGQFYAIPQDRNGYSSKTMMAAGINLLKQHERHVDVETDTPSGGYDVVLVSEMPKKYKCPLCNHLMRAPIQTYKGELACESCYIEAVKNSSGLCPINHEEIETQNGEMLFKDNHARREVLQLQCHCSNKRNECQWTGTVSDLENHLRGCKFKEIICTQCNYLILQKNEEEHMTQECKFRKATCVYCGVNFSAQSLPDHKGGCERKPMQCPYDCGQSLILENIFQHIEHCSEIKKGRICPYTIVGCRFEPRSPEDLQDHMINEAQKHAAVTITLVTALNQSNERLRQELLREQNIQVDLAQKTNEQKGGYSGVSTEIENVKEKLYSIQQEGLVLAQGCDVNEAKIKDGIAQIDSKLQQHAIGDIHRKVEEVRTKYQEFEVRIRSDGSTGEGACNSDEIKQINETINQLEMESAVLSANLADLELKFQQLENTSYSGKQLWKVDNVMHRMNQAVTGKVTALHSVACFQSKGGYKFCTRLYLNGDGMGRGTHLSLFFVLMKSQHDALLKWPFSERVTFRLINPYNRGGSQKESFIPDKNSSSFKCPTREMNVAAGCPMFLRKERLPGFIIDDAIYIECWIGSELLTNY